MISRREAKEHLDKHLATIVAGGLVPENDDEVVQDDQWAQLDAQLRPTWGHDAEAQAQWVK